MRVMFMKSSHTCSASSPVKPKCCCVPKGGSPPSVARAKKSNGVGRQRASQWKCRPWLRNANACKLCTTGHDKTLRLHRHRLQLQLHAFTWHTASRYMILRLNNLIISKIYITLRCVTLHSIALHYSAFLLPVVPHKATAEV